MRKSIVILSIILVATLSGCSRENEEVKLLDTIDQIQGLEDYEPSGVLAESFSKNVTYQVSDISWDGDSGVAQVIVTTPDLSQIISDSVQSAIDEHGTDDYDVLLDSAKENIQVVLSSEDYPTLESDIEMEAEKNDEGYTLISNEDFEKIVQGNLEKIFLNVLMEQRGES